MGYLFFSYSRKDETQARANVENLAAEGFIIWQDIREGDEGIPPGADFEQRIKNAIESPECEGLILQWSKSADKSCWVKKEISLALAAEKTIYPLLLDGTKLPVTLEKKNYTRQAEIERLINHLYSAAPNSRRQRLDFSPDVALGLQTNDSSKAMKIDGNQFVAVPLLQSSYTHADVVGFSDHAIGEPSHVLLCAEFTGIPSPLFLTETLRFFISLYPGESYVALHVTPAKRRKGEYKINDNNYAEWADAAGTCIEAVQMFRQTKRAKVHIFAKMPVALGILLSTHFSTGTELYLYNDIPASNSNGITYAEVAKVITR